jgi:hypothetical protein
MRPPIAATSCNIYSHAATRVMRATKQDGLNVNLAGRITTVEEAERARHV